MRYKGVKSAPRNSIQDGLRAISKKKGEASLRRLYCELFHRLILDDKLYAKKKKALTGFLMSEVLQSPDPMMEEILKLGVSNADHGSDPDANPHEFSSFE